MDIPINANVQCTDGPCGHSTYVVVNPISKVITHVVVKNSGFSHPERLVPVKHIVASSPEEIRLGCSRQDVESMKRFHSVEFIRGTVSHLTYDPDQYMLWPFQLPPDDLEPEYIPVEHEQIPPDEVAVHRGSRVEATNGPIGHVSEFLVDPGSERITHMILRKGHLWNTREFTIPVSLIKFIEEDAVYLTVDKAAVEQLPVTLTQDKPEQVR